MAVGALHPDHLAAALSSEQITGWMAYAKVEAFGERAAWMRNATQLSMLANINRDPRRSKLTSPDDFMPKWKYATGQTKEVAAPREAQSPEELQEGIRMIGMMARRAQRKKDRKKRKRGRQTKES